MMIAKLTGTVAGIRVLHIVVDVHDIGYLVAVRAPLDFKIGNQIELHTHLAVRENALDLYGFEILDELEMFEHLLKLPGIGPKSAMQILAQADIMLLKKAAISGDSTYLSKMSGIGKKSAEKIVTGLRDIFDEAEILDISETHHGDSDIVDALISLGYTQKDARDALQKLDPDITGTNERIKAALKLISS